MNRLKKLVAIGLSIATVSGVSVAAVSLPAQASGTGAGLAEWALNAYYSNWSYVWGGSSEGAVDCSGLIWSYCGGERMDMLGASTESGSVSAGIPRVHGLGLYQPGHVGVYVGDGMEVDARSEYYGVCYQSVESNWTGWSYWFKLAAVSYPDYGWEEFNGNYYFYEDGQYIVNTSRTIDGETYYFDASGVSSTTPSSTSVSSSSSSSSSSSGSSKPAKKTVWSNGDSGDEVEKIQERLAELGYYNGEISGYFGDATESAFIAFQKAAGLTPDGVAGSDRDVLYSDDAPEYTAPKQEEKTEEETMPAEENKADSEDNAEAKTDDEKKADENTDMTAISEGDFSDEVAAVQSRLSELGYFGLEATGFFGEYTTQAIAQFQKANGIEATGVLDEATYNQLMSEKAVKSAAEPIEYTENMNTGIAESTGPVQIVGNNSAAPSNLIVSSKENAGYTDDASKTVKKTNEITKKALANSSDMMSAVSLSKVKRSANVWIWFVLTAIILATLSIILLKRTTKKASRYDKYLAKKKKNETKAQLNKRW